MTRQSTEIRQEQIKQAVLDIILNKGMDELTIRNIAQHIELSETAIFRHFASKQDIFISLLRDVQVEFIGPLNRIERYATSPKESLEQIICTTVKYLNENNGITLILLAIAVMDNYEQLKSELWLLFNSQKQLVSKILQDGVEKGIWTGKIPVEELALIYMIIPVFLNIQLILNGKEAKAQDACENSISLLMRILKY